MKMTSGIIIIIILAIIAGFKFFKNKNHGETEQIKFVYDKEEAEKFVMQLDELGYFKYADNSEVDILKTTFIKEFNPQGELVSIWDDKTHLPKDYRYYFCDGETIFEADGITELLKDLKPVFDKMKFKCDITNHFEEWDDINKWVNHRITINGTEYVIFRNFKGYGWGEAPMRIAEILNIELKKQNKDERIYLVHGGNDGRLALLTEKQYKFIYNVYTDENWKPLEISEWAKVFKVQKFNLD